jgi:hypothetical protein
VTSVCDGNVEIYAVGMVSAIGQVARLNRRLQIALEWCGASCI